MFKVEYFGRPAFLAQSPQLAKQMAVIADMGRVYEIGSSKYGSTGGTGKLTSGWQSSEQKTRILCDT